MKMIKINFSDLHLSGTTLCIAFLLIMPLRISSGQPFLPPGPIYANAASDSGDEATCAIAADLNGFFHAVWSSDEDLLGSGTDIDLFYSVFTEAGWSTPELVNLNGLSDGAPDAVPRLAVDTLGTIHCVWLSEDPYAGSGADVDLLYAQRTSTGWSNPELVNQNYAINDTSNETTHGMTIGRDGVVHVVWSSSENLNLGSVGSIGPDRDMLHSARTNGVWNSLNKAALNRSYLLARLRPK